MKNSKKIIFYGLFILLDFILLSLIFLLGIKIYRLINGNVKGVYITNIPKQNIIFPSNENNLKFFFEPKPNDILITNPHWLGYDVKNTVNSDTIHSTIEFSMKKDIHVYRILALGDSFTFGYGVNTDENYIEKLQSLLNLLKCQNITKFEVINLGVEGYDVEYTIERLKKRGLKYNPDLIIYLINNWNFEIRNEIQHPLMLSLMNSGIPLQDEKTGVYTAYNIAKQMYLKEYPLELTIEFQKKRLYSLAEIYKNNLLILTFPSNSSSIKNLLETFTKINSHYSFYPVSNLLNNSEYILKDGHLNKKGHDKLAQDIMKILIKRYFNDCNNIYNK